MRIELATIVVDDYDRAVEFFVGALGFELVEDSAALTNDGRPKRWVVVRPPGAETGILLARAEGERQASAVGNQTAGRVGFFLRVDDFDAAHERMRTAGVEFVSLATRRALRTGRRVRRHRRQPMGPPRRRLTRVSGRARLADEEREAPPAPGAVDLHQPGGAHPPELRFDLGEHVLGIAAGPADAAVELLVELRRGALDDHRPRMLTRQPSHAPAQRAGRGGSWSSSQVGPTTSAPLRRARSASPRSAETSTTG